MSTTTYDSAWDLSLADRLLVEAKHWGSRLRFAVMLLFYRARGRFPRSRIAFSFSRPSISGRAAAIPPLTTRLPQPAHTRPRAGADRRRAAPRPASLG